MNLLEVDSDARRLATRSPRTRADAGPVFGGIECFQTDPHWAPGVVRRSLPLL